MAESPRRPTPPRGAGGTTWSGVLIAGWLPFILTPWSLSRGAGPSRWKNRKPCRPCRSRERISPSGRKAAPRNECRDAISARDEVKWSVKGALRNLEHGRQGQCSARRAFRGRAPLDKARGGGYKVATIHSLTGR